MGGMEVDIAALILNVGSTWRWSALRPGRFISGEGPAGTHWIGGQLDPRVWVDILEDKKMFSPAGIRTQGLQVFQCRYYTA